MKAFQHMTDRLQKANLTINFQAEAWFSTPNNYESYTQMYERAIKTFGEGPTGKVAHMVLKGDKLNPATTRANADDRATFGAHFLNADGTFKPEVGGIGRMMSPGSLVQSGSSLEGKAEYVASNPAFNPKSKQVFAALDYGRRHTAVPQSTAKASWYCPKSSRRMQSTLPVTLFLPAMRQ